MSAFEINGLEQNCKPKRRRWEDHLDELVPPFAWLPEYFDRLIRAGKTRSKQRGMSHGITADYLTDLAEAQRYRCVISGIEFEQSTYWRTKRRNPFSPSIDRIDNARGYEIGNVRIVCLIVNLARSNFDDSALVKMAKAIVDRASCVPGA